MIVYLNNKQVNLPQAKSISQIIAQDFNLPGAKGIAVAVNQEVIPKTIWETYEVKENDKVTVIKATQGG